MPQITRLMQLIVENSKQKGFSEHKIRRIVNLVKTTLEYGVPEQEDLKDLLEEIGRLQ